MSWVDIGAGEPPIEAFEGSFFFTQDMGVQDRMYVTRFFPKTKSTIKVFTGEGYATCLEIRFDRKHEGADAHFGVENGSSVSFRFDPIETEHLLVNIQKALNVIRGDAK